MPSVKSVVRNYKVCEDSLRWVLNYRVHVRNGQVPKDIGRLLDADGHSGGSYSWTKKQAEVINAKGFNYWLDMTDGPRGYSHWLNKL